ncbi:MAG TPA: hypothetical protein VFV34_06650, partial [Blastocatellia bacterium]|nr:hypothetical protein [Blastocatellia bacterium]
WSSKREGMMGLPVTAELADRGLQAMKSFAGRDRYDFAAGDWTITTRPVRASAQSCLSCHMGNETRTVVAANQAAPASSLKIGDPLGVLFYAYKQR